MEVPPNSYSFTLYQLPVKNWPHTIVTGTLHMDVHNVYKYCGHTLCEMSKSGCKIEVLCIVWELGPIVAQTSNPTRGLYNPVAMSAC